jgi:HEPN domain-containing protein
MDDAKRELVLSWLIKASHDLGAAKLLGATGQALRNVAGYHCQQAAEKALKAFLVYHDERVEKTHDVGLLIERAMTIEPGFGSWLDMGDWLTPYATAYCYPGQEDQPELEDFEEAIDAALTIFRQVLSFLPPEVHPEDWDSIA